MSTTVPASRHRAWLRPRRLVPLALVVLVAAGAAHTLLWRMMGQRLQEGFDAWAAQRRAQGWVVEHGPPLRGGWPFSATLRLPGFRLAGGAATVPGGLDWRAPAVTLRVAMPRLDELRIAASGPQRLRLGEVEIPFAADRLVGTLPLQSGVLPRGGEFEAVRLRVGGAAGGVDIGQLSASIDTRMTAIEGESALNVVLRANAIMLPGPTPLGPLVQEAGLEAAMTGPWPGGRAPAARAESWRDAGGTLELRGATLRWGPVGASAAATLALDDTLQPMGAGTLRLTGAGEAVDALANAGLIPQRNAALARRVVTLLARPPAEGEPPQLEVPLTLEDRSLSIARIPVARLAPVDWPR